MFTTYKTELPQLGLLYFVLLGLPGYLAYRYYNRKAYQQLFVGMQLASWTALFLVYARLPPRCLRVCLFLSRCRMAMFAFDVSA